MDIISFAHSVQDELIAIRRYLHAHPELGLDVHRTSDLVAGKLEEWGVEVHRGIGRTGLVGVLRAGNGPGAIGLRADMDALAIQEENKFSYRSKISGRMHACGHDGHTTMLLGAARYLAQTRRFDGTVNLIFQPGEEGAGGAQAMIADGLFDRFPCDAIYALHNSPSTPLGKFSISPGQCTAGGAFFDILVAGRGTHAAWPSRGVDPVLVACHITSALQSVVSRNVPAEDSAVLTVTRIVGSDAHNVIPEAVTVSGTARAHKKDIMQLLEQRLRGIAEGVATGFGATAKVDFRILFVPLVNDAAEMQIVADVAAEFVGKDNVDCNKPPNMGSEDFGFMVEKVPGVYINVGNGGGNSLHSPHYDFNDEAMPYGVGLFVHLVQRKLGSCARTR